MSGSGKLARQDDRGGGGDGGDDQGLFCVINFEAAAALKLSDAALES